ncbi:MAG: zinc-ribbon domain-containing protein [Candidatus Geothermincolia bacterium]
MEDAGQGVIRVFCNECGKSVSEGSKFCLNCGSPLPTVPLAAFTPPNAAPQQPDVQQPHRKGGGAFFSSPAGIALVVIIGVAVLAGIAFGIVYAVKGSSNSAVDAETARVWDEYESIANADSADLAKISMDQTALAKTQEDLKKTQEKVAALEMVLKNTGGTTARRQGKKSTSTRDIKADQMAAALAAYNTYVTRMNELFKTLAGANLADPNVVNTLNKILAELQNLSAQVKSLSNKFLADNTQVTAKTFNPPVLATPKAIAAEVQKNVTASQAAEQQQQESELVTCPACGGSGIREGSDSSWTCTFCNGTGRVTREKAATYVNVE